jgi:oxygen-dependent protoporphyrinogen oxidase
VYRLPAAMPQLEVGHLAQMASIERRLSKVPGLFISAAGFRGVGLPDCVNDATMTAECAISYLTRTGSPKSMAVCAS